MSSTISAVFVEPGPADRSPETKPAPRDLALDAYRGFIMLLLVSEGFGFTKLWNHPAYQAIARQFDHRDWGGAVFWDLIMPAFLFMVGVAMTYSFGRRMEEGADRSKLLRHLVKRAGILTVASWIIISVETNHLHLQAHNVLIQVAATSLVCFFLMQLPFSYQMGAAVLLLAFHSSLYLIFPGPDGAFQRVTNFGAVLDRAIMGHNYRMAPCVNLNTIPEVVNVLIGIWIGNLLRSPRSLSDKFKWMIGGMLIAFAAGLALSPIVPINKWLWTASYALYTSGWAIFGLILFYLLVEIFNLRRPMFFLVVVGMNSLFVYCVGEILHGWLDQSVGVLTGRFLYIGELAPVAQACAVLAVIWYLSYWLYQHKIFIRA